MWAGPVPPRLKQSYAGSSEVIFLILELNNLRMQVIFSNLLPAVSSPRCEMGVFDVSGLFLFFVARSPQSALKYLLMAVVLIPLGSRPTTTKKRRECSRYSLVLFGVLKQRLHSSAWCWNGTPNTPSERETVFTELVFFLTAAAYCFYFPFSVVISLNLLSFSGGKDFIFFFHKKRKKMQWQCNERSSSYAPLPSFLVQRSKLSMQCNFSDHIVAFGSGTEWLSDIFTARLRLHQLSPRLLSKCLLCWHFISRLIAAWLQGRLPPAPDYNGTRGTRSSARGPGPKGEPSGINKSASAKSMLISCKWSRLNFNKPCQHIHVCSLNSSAAHSGAALQSKKNKKIKSGLSPWDRCSHACHAAA